MQEALLHYIWKYSLYESRKYQADTGEFVRIIEPGLHNHDGGPDFTNARIEIEDTVWAGNIEIHIQASDWYTHNHHLDSTYDNVILHVVTNNNRECFNSQGRLIPCITIKPNVAIESRYIELIQSNHSIPCNMFLNSFDPIRKSLWLSTLTVERLEQKSRYFHELLAYTKNNWEETLFIHLARSFGLKINALPFELLAKSFPLKSIISQPGNLFRTEAILFGQAGFLEEIIDDDYHAQLRKEYQYHRRKYSLKPMKENLWRFLRLRPLNFPTIRIAQFSDLLTRNSNLLSQTIDCSTPQDLKEIYSCKVSDYWETHYSFGVPSAKRNKKLGVNTINTIIINTIVPLLFVYGNVKNRNDVKEKAISFLEQLPAEKNHITRTCKELGFPCRQAAESQALFELTERYCSEKRCLDCQIGNLLLSDKNIWSAKV